MLLSTIEHCSFTLFVEVLLVYVVSVGLFLKGQIALDNQCATLEKGKGRKDKEAHAQMTGGVKLTEHILDFSV